eukprot:359740-Chlamydomonas_euryale.AAC.1
MSETAPPCMHMRTCLPNTSWSLRPSARCSVTVNVVTLDMVRRRERPRLSPGCPEAAPVLWRDARRGPPGCARAARVAAAEEEEEAAKAAAGGWTINDCPAGKCALRHLARGAERAVHAREEGLPVGLRSNGRRGAGSRVQRRCNGCGRAFDSAVAPRPHALKWIRVAKLSWGALGKWSHGRAIGEARVWGRHGGGGCSCPAALSPTPAAGRAPEASCTASGDESGLREDATIKRCCVRPIVDSLRRLHSHMVMGRSPTAHAPRCSPMETKLV